MHGQIFEGKKKKDHFFASVVCLFVCLFAYNCRRGAFGASDHLGQSQHGRV